MRNQNNHSLTRRHRTRIARWAIALAAMAGIGHGSLSEVNAAPTPLLVAGSPTYDSTTGSGYQNGDISVSPGSGVNNSGTAVGRAIRVDGSVYKGYRAVVWDGSGTVATELGNLGLDVGGLTTAQAYAINDAGMAVGTSFKHDGGVYKGSRAVRWDASSSIATELGNLGLSASGTTSALATAINDTGMVVGYSNKYDGAGTDKGVRAVRWDGSGTVATELGNLGLDSSGGTVAHAYAVNDAGTAVGVAIKYDSGISKRSRAVRWDASGTSATELGNLGLSATGMTSAVAYAVNDAGTAVGRSDKYVSGVDKGTRAVRWDGSDTIATELGNLGLDGSGWTSAQAYAVNDTGTAVGSLSKYVSGGYKGFRAVRWNGSSTIATELGHLGLDASGVTYAQAYAVNDAGTAVGVSSKYVSGVNQGGRAVIWLPDASAIDLNDLGIMSVPVGGTWLLAEARAFSSDGWVAGTGTFTPTVGSAYTRHWVTQVGLGGSWTDDFSGTLDGTWGRGKQWSTGTPAMQVGNATFDANAAYTVSLDRDELTNAINITAGTVTFNHNGFSLTATDGITIGSGAMLKSSGMIIGDVIVQGTIAPGNSPGTMPIVGNSTWASGGSFEWEINKADGTAGADPGWDVYAITGILNIAASAGNEFTIDLTTLDLLNAAGLMDGFDAASDYAWTIATADGGITGFDATDFLLDTSAFMNSINGTFAISQIGNRIDLTYTATISVPSGTVPEPSSALLFMLIGAASMLRRSRNQPNA